MRPESGAEERSALIAILLGSGAIRFGRFTLASGLVSDVYVDIKQAWTDPGRLGALADALARRAGDCDRLAGMELGAVPLVVATALRIGKPIVVIRKAVKEHGTGQRFEGTIPEGSRVLLLEDVCTTGGTAEDSVHVIRAAGGVIDRVLAVVDRGMGGRERLQREGVRLDPLLTLDDLQGARA